MTPQVFLHKIPHVKVLQLKATSLTAKAVNSLKLPPLTFKDLTLKAPSLTATSPKSSSAPKPPSTAAQPARVETATDRFRHIEPGFSSSRARMTVLSVSIAAMALLATGGMAMGPPFEPQRMSSMNAVQTEGYPVFDRFGDRVGRIASVVNVEGRTLWLNVALEDGGMAKVASFRGFLDARNKEVGLVLTRDSLEERAYEQANDAADEAAYKAVLGDDDVVVAPDPAKKA